MAKKHSTAPLFIILIGFAIGFLFGRGLEWDFDAYDDDDWDEDQWS